MNLELFVVGPENVSNGKNKNNLKTIVVVFGAMAAAFVIRVVVGVVFKSQIM